MHRLTWGVLLLVSRIAMAQPDAPPDNPPTAPVVAPDPAPAPNLTVQTDPTPAPVAPIIVAPPPAVPVTDVTEQFHPLRAKLTVAGMYAGFMGWMYIAWYQHHRALANYKWGGDDEDCGHESGLGRWFSRCALIGWAGDQTYAGGEDKFGHAWSTMSLARLTDEILEQWGGIDHQTSLLVGVGLAEALFIGVEVRDGFNFEFSFSDVGGDTVGALAALALMEFPRLDEMFDFRVQYFPSQMYLRKLDGSSPCPYGGCSRWNIAEDYSGQTYLLAFHLGSIHSLRDMEYGTISRFVDLTLGFDTRNYKPVPDADLMATPRQEMFVGISLNAQGILDWLLEGRPSQSAKTLRKVTHGMFEVFNLPGTSLRILEHDHSPCPTCPVNEGGA